MELPKTLGPAEVVGFLINGSRSEREAVLRLTSTWTDPGDLNALCEKLLEALSSQFFVRTDDPESDKPVAAVRSWILTQLARLKSCPAALDEARKHTDAAEEPDSWCRYWALVGFIRASDPRLEETARHIASGEKDVLPRQLAVAVLAKLGDAEARQRISDALNTPDLAWSALRALRIVPLAGTARRMSELVRVGAWTDETYDAVIALAEIPTGPVYQEEVDVAAQALGYLISAKRRYPMWDSMRMNAIVALGRLGAREMSATLTDELLDDNPGIVREAARALEDILGSRTATARVLEAASLHPFRGGDYALALRWMNRDQVAEELDAAMSSAPGETQDMARVLLSEIGGTVALQKLRSRQQAIEQYIGALGQAERAITTMFQNSIQGARTGFQVTLGMDVTVFALGIILIAVSAYLAIRDKQLSNWVTGASGGTGVAGVLYTLFVGKPREKVMEATDHLMDLQTVFLTFLHQLNQADQAYTRRLLEDKPLTPPELKEFSAVVGDVLDHARGCMVDKNRLAGTTHGDTRGRKPEAETRALHDKAPQEKT